MDKALEFRYLLQPTDSELFVGRLLFSRISEHLWRLRPLISLLLLVLYLDCLFWAQVARVEFPDETSSSDAFPTISKSVDEVPLNFIVTDQKGKFVKSLQVSDFKLLDDGRPPERIAHFRASTDSPLRVTLLFDISSSIRYRLDFEKKAASQFLKDILRPDVDRANVISFGDEVQEVQGLTSDISQLASAVAHLQAGGMTTLYDAIIRACEHLRSTPGSDEARKVIIILSDGADTASKSNEKLCKKAVVAAETTIVVVDASVPSESNSPGQRFLKKLVEDSGGLTLPAREDRELRNAFRTIESALRSQYALSYKPSALVRNGAFRAIELTAPKRGLTVHSRKGYYATETY